MNALVRTKSIGSASSLVAVLMLFALTACGGSGDDDGGSTPPVQPPAPAPAPVEPPAPTPAPAPTRVSEVEASLLAGSPRGFGFADGEGVKAFFGMGPRLAWGVNGDILVADPDNNAVRRVTPTGLVTTIAGRGLTMPLAPTFADGPVATAVFARPHAAVEDKAGNVYVADTDNHLVRKIDSSGNVTTLAGKVGVCGDDDGQSTAATLCRPTSMVVDSAGNLYVSGELEATQPYAQWPEDPTYQVITHGNYIRKITPDGAVTTVTKQMSQFPSRFESPVRMTFYRYALLAMDANDNLYAADLNDNVIRKILPDGSSRVLSGTPAPSYAPGGIGFVDGPAHSVKFRDISGITFDSANRMWVMDHGGAAAPVGATNFRYVAPDGAVTTIYQQDGCTQVRDPISLCYTQDGAAANFLVDPSGRFVTAEAVRGMDQPGGPWWVSAILRRYTPVR